jgi:hypothetical protein
MDLKVRSLGIRSKLTARRIKVETYGGVEANIEECDVTVMEPHPTLSQLK